MSQLVAVAIECSEFDEPLVAVLSDAFGGLCKLNVPDPYIMYIGLIDQTLIDLPSALKQFKESRWFEAESAKLVTLSATTFEVVLGNKYNSFHPYR